jgi:allantoin racemase
LACLLGRRFSIVTPWYRWRYLHERTLDAYDLGSRCASIRSLDSAGSSSSVAGLTAIAARAVMESDPEYYPTLLEVVEKCIGEDGADVIVLGSATMDRSCEFLRERVVVPIVNPGPAAVKAAEMLVKLRLAHSKATFPAPETLQDEKYSSLPNKNEA